MNAAEATKRTTAEKALRINGVPAHKLARIVYLALKHGLTYMRQSQEEYEARMKEKQIKALRRKARQLGLDLVEKTPGGVPPANAASAQG